MKIFLKMFLLTAVLAFLWGCGGEKPQIDTKPFEAAIADYCKSHSFGMKVKEFVNIDVDGNSATAVCKMAEAEGTYNVSVKWTFTLVKGSDGKWKVSNHKM